MVSWLCFSSYMVSRCTSHVNPSIAATQLLGVARWLRAELSSWRSSGVWLDPRLAHIWTMCTVGGAEMSAPCWDDAVKRVPCTEKKHFLHAEQLHWMNSDKICMRELRPLSQCCEWVKQEWGSLEMLLALIQRPSNNKSSFQFRKDWPWVLMK